MIDPNSENWDNTELDYVDSFDSEYSESQTDGAGTGDGSATGQTVYDESLSYEENSENEEDEDDDEDEEDDDDEYEEGRPLIHTLIYMLFVLLFSVICAILMWFAADDVLALTKDDYAVTITVNDEDTLYDVAETLQLNGLIRYKYLFILYGEFSHAEDKIEQGTFELNQMYDYHALVNSLSSNSENRKTVTLTFPEGYSADQIITMLAENDVCSEEALREAAANHEFDYDFLEDIPYGEYNRLEGYLFPDTYEFYVGDDAVRVLNKFLYNFDYKLDENVQDAIDELNASLRTAMETDGSFTEEEIEASMMDLYDVITVASLIEKEAGSNSERTLIASVIYNRLTSKVHELLQIDATVEYALGEHKEVLTANDLGVDSPYNTYKYKGLPPGPIANPGYSSIMAALYPEESSYLFYALNDYGTHEFFDNYIDQQDYINSRSTADTEEAEAGETTEEETPATIPYYQTVITNENGEEETVNVQ